MKNYNFKIRSKAPLRLGLAGGGTDVSPYSEKFGGCVLNATINMYAHSFLEHSISKTAEFHAFDLNIKDSIDLDSEVKIEGPLLLHRAVYKKIMDRFNDSKYIPIKMITFCDSPPGSGLGSSSAIVVSMIEAYKEFLSLPLGEYDIAKLAYEIERLDCNLSGGKQDQYASAFGGFNFMEFERDDRVIVNPLRIRKSIIDELQSSLILYFIGASRDSATIINDQINTINESGKALEAMHAVKNNAYKIKELLLKSDIDGVANKFKESWDAKKSTSKSISNSTIDLIEKRVLNCGAKSIKVSGAGGGGFIMIFIDPEKKLIIKNVLSEFRGKVQDFNFIREGCHSWKT